MQGQCKHCGARFVQPHPPKRFCTRRCGYADRKERYRAKIEAQLPEPAATYLRRRYVDEFAAVLEIATEIGTAAPYLTNWLQDLGIALRSHAENTRRAWLTSETMLSSIREARAKDRTGIMLVCQLCGEMVYRSKSRIARGERYCSKACELAATPRITKRCPQCAKDFTVFAATAARYTVCSRTCRLAETKYVACERCGTVFRAEKRLNRHYCSETCRRPPVYVKCIRCKKRWRDGPSNRRRFCSKACYRKFDGETDLERKVREALDVLGIIYHQEFQIGRYSVDFILPFHWIALEADGDYWHLNPARDRRKNARLASEGWRIVRVTETDVNAAVSVSALIAERLAQSPT